MTEAEFSLIRTRRFAAAFAGRVAQLLLFAIVLLLAALFVPDPMLGFALLAASGAVALMATVIRLLAMPRAGLGVLRPLQAAQGFAGADPAPAFLTAADGALLWRNRAACKRFGDGSGPTLTRALGELFASPAAVVHRLGHRAEAEGAAREDVVTRHGHVRISVHRLGRGIIFWRLDEFTERTGARGADAIGLPMMTIGRGGAILFVNRAGREVLGARPRRLAEVLPGEVPPSGALGEIVTRDGVRTARLIDLPAQGGRRELYFLPVAPAGAEMEAAGRDRHIDALPVALCRLDAAGRVLEINRAARALLGRDGPGFRLSDVIEGPGRPFLDWLADAASGRLANTSEVVGLRRDSGAGAGAVQIAVSPMATEDGPVLLAVLSDVSARRTLEAQLQQSQKMQAVGQLAGGIAHDFNNILTAISGHCDLLLRRSDEAAAEYADLMQIRQNANRAADLVARLLAFSRKQTRHPEQLDMRETVGDMTHMLNRLVGDQVRLVVTQERDLVPIRGDRRQIEQVLMNLVVNARDAMPEGGEIRIELGGLRLDEEVRRDRAVIPPGPYLVIRIVDQGTGIPAEFLPDIFEPFFTTKAPGEGTGLGLATVYGIVKQSGGFVFVDSAPGAGTCFTLYFPARESTDPEQDAAGAPPEADEGPGLAALPEGAVRPRAGGGDGAGAPEREGAGATVHGDATAPAASSGVDGAGRGGRTQVTTVPAAPDWQDRPPGSHAATSGGLPVDRSGADDQAGSWSPPVSLDEAGEAATPGAPEGGATPAGPAPGDGVQTVHWVHVPKPCCNDTGTDAATTVLLVEDEAPVRSFAARALSSAGHRVLEAETAEQALERLDDHAGAVDVVVTDLVMPGLHGRDWIELARRRAPAAGLVLVSGYADTDPDEIAGFAPGAEFLAKPFSLDELLAAVARQLAPRAAIEADAVAGGR